MTTLAQADKRLARDASPFAPQHPWDRNFFLLYVALIWLGIAMGFGPEIAKRLREHAPPYPAIVPVHAIAFAAWVWLLTAQVLLIRTKRFAIHRRLGVAGAVLAGVMVVIGPATALVMDAYHFGTPEGDTAFLSIQLTDIAAFAGLVAAALTFRNLPSAHKRLILLATLYISDAGFARWLGDGVHAQLGDGVLPMMAAAYLGNDLLVVGLGAYDLITRRRLHPAYIGGVAWTLALQTTGAWLYYSPAWNQAALRLIGH